MIKVCGIGVYNIQKTSFECLRFSYKREADEKNWTNKKQEESQKKSQQIKSKHVHMTSIKKCQINVKSKESYYLELDGKHILSFLSL